MDIRDLFGEVLREARDVPDPRISYGLNRAAREFCRQTWWLRRQLQFTCVPGQATYTLLGIPNEEILNVKHAQLQQVNSSGQVSGSQIALKFFYGTIVNPNIGSAQPVGMMIVNYQTVVLSPTPDNPYPITLEVVTQPFIDSQYIPDELGREWDQALGSGALSWILRQNGNSWTDTAGAQFHMLEFNKAIARGRAKAAYDFTPNNRAWISSGFMRWR